MLTACPFSSKRRFKYMKSIVDYIENYHERSKKLGHPHGTIKEIRSDQYYTKDYLPHICSKRIKMSSIAHNIFHSFN
jgi:hypothetical protein